MSEIRSKLQVFELDYACDKCGNGRMRPEGVVYPTSPPQYPHVCDNCGSKMTFRAMYPRIAYFYKGTDIEVETS